MRLPQLWHIAPVCLTILSFSFDKGFLSSRQHVTLSLHPLTNVLRMEMLGIIMPGYWMNWIRKFWVIVFDSALHEKTKWRNILWKNSTHPSCSVDFNGRKQRNSYLKPVVSALKFLLQVSAVPYHFIHNTEYKLLHDIKVSYQYIDYRVTMCLRSLDAQTQTDSRQVHACQSAEALMNY